MTMPVLSSSARLLARSIPIVSQRLENGPVAICVPTYRLQVRIIKRQASLSLGLSFFARCIQKREWRNPGTGKIPNGDTASLGFNAYKHRLGFFLVLDQTIKKKILYRNLSTQYFVLLKAVFEFVFVFDNERKQQKAELRILIESSGGELKTHLASPPCPAAGWTYTTVQLQMEIQNIEYTTSLYS